MGFSSRDHLEKVVDCFVPLSPKKNNLRMAETVETTTPTVEEVKAPEVATNGEAEAAAAETEKNGTTEESTNGSDEVPESSNGTTEAEAKETNGDKAEETEATNGDDAEAKATEEETTEATKRKADEPVEDETVEKIAKLKEAAAGVVAEAEKALPSEPLNEAEATA